MNGTRTATRPETIVSVDACNGFPAQIAFDHRFTLLRTHFIASG